MLVVDSKHKTTSQPLKLLVPVPGPEPVPVPEQLNSMDQPPRVVTVSSRPLSNSSSSVSLAETFHSFSTTLPDDFAEKNHYLYRDLLSGSGMAGSRKDSGYGEESAAIRAIIAGSTGVGGQQPCSDMEAVNIGSASCPTTPTQKPTVPVQHAQTQTDSTAQRPSGGYASIQQRRAHSHNNSRSLPHHRSRSSSRPPSIVAAAGSHTTPITLNLARSNSGRDPYAAHQRARELMESLNRHQPVAGGHSSSWSQSQSSERSRPHHPGGTTASFPSRVRTRPPPPPTISASSLLAARHSFSIDGRPPVDMEHHNNNTTTTGLSNSPFDPISPVDTLNCPPATIIDWTHPTTRRRAYERHDRRGRGLEGFFRNLFGRVSKRGRASAAKGELGFWEGKEGEDDDGDGGSVRRYRIQLDEKDDDNDEAGRQGPQVKKFTKAWSCFGSASTNKQQAEDD